MTESFKTGEKVSVSGIYSYKGPTDKKTSCAPTQEEQRIPLSKGETFPPIKSCKRGAKWELEESA